MPIPTDVRNAVISAYYPRALAASDAARSRAQAGYGVASAIAAALVAAGVFGGLAHKPLGTQLVGVAALVSWLAAAGFFLVAVSSPFLDANAQATQQSAEAFVYAALEQASNESKAVDRWQYLARVAAGIAAVLTTAAFALAIFDTPSEEISGIVRLTADGRVAVGVACGVNPHPIEASVSMAALEQDFVPLVLSTMSCKHEGVRVLVPRGDLLSISSESSRHVFHVKAPAPD